MKTIGSLLLGFGVLAAAALAACGGEETATTEQKPTVATSAQLEALLGWGDDCLLWEMDANESERYWLEIRRGQIYTFDDQLVYRMMVYRNNNPKARDCSAGCPIACAEGTCPIPWLLREMSFELTDGQIILLGSDFDGSILAGDGFIKYEPAVLFMRPVLGADGTAGLAPGVDMWKSTTKRANNSEEHAVTVTRQINDFALADGGAIAVLEMTHSHGAETDTYYLAPGKGLLYLKFSERMVKNDQTVLKPIELVAKKADAEACSASYAKIQLDPPSPARTD